MKRAGFTLMELLIVILIIGLLAGLSIAALSGAAEQARASRTRSILAKLEQLVGDKWESYRTRTLPIRTTGLVPRSENFIDSNDSGFWNAGETFTDANGNGVYDRGATYARLMGLRELQRMEFPDRITDVLDPATGAPEPTFTGMPICSLQRAYYRKALSAVGTASNWSPENQGAECLFLIVSCLHDGDKNALDFFSPAEIGDVDGDNMREILDGWGNPIHFLRWAPAFTQELTGSTGRSAITPQTSTPGVAPDRFDPVREDRRATYDLRPLILSAGQNEIVDVALDFGPLPYHAAAVGNDPYFVPPTPYGQLGLVNLGGSGEWLDNLTNHSIEP